MTGPGGTDRLATVEEALEVVLAAIPGPTDVEAVALVEALGRTLATDVIAPFDLPPWDNSAMDGYAIRSADVAGASDGAPVALRVVGDLAAGAGPDRTVGRGEAVRIATGAPVPTGADAVVPVEATTPGDADGRPTGPRSRDAAGAPPPTCLIHAPVGRGASIRLRGDDIIAGSTILTAGSRVGPAAVAVAAGVGVRWIDARARPVVGVLATGDELRADGSALGPAGIPDSNGPTLQALAEAAGADPRSLGIARDRLDDVRARLCAGLVEGADLIVVSGGVSVGPFDHVRAAFAELGSVDLWRVAVQPGKPFAFGLAERPGGGRPVLLFGLPGNPVSTFVTFELFVRPAIRRFLGDTHVRRPSETGVLLDAVTKSRGRRAYVRVVADRDAAGAPRRDAVGRVLLRLAGGQRGQGSHVLSALAVAEGLAAVPEALVDAPAGTAVEVSWFDRG